MDDFYVYVSWMGVKIVMDENSIILVLLRNIILKYLCELMDREGL